MSRRKRTRNKQNRNAETPPVHFRPRPTGETVTHSGPIPSLGGKTQTYFVVPQVHGAEQGPEGAVQGEREFDVWGALTSQPRLWDAQVPKLGEPPQGNSLIFFLPKGYLEVEGGVPQKPIRFQIYTNDEGFLSGVKSRLTAERWSEAIEVFRQALDPFLSTLSWQYQVPLMLASVGGMDLTNGVMFQEHVFQPDIGRFGGSAEVGASGEYQAAYSFFREGTNSASPAYRLLCFYKSYQVFRHIEKKYEDYITQKGLAKSDFFRGIAVHLEQDDIGPASSVDSPFAGCVGMSIGAFMIEKVRPIRNKVAHTLEETEDSAGFSDADSLEFVRLARQFSDVLVPLIRRYAERLIEFSRNHPDAQPTAYSTLH